MKLLMAIESQDNVENIGTTLAWASRAGYPLRIFIKESDHEQYETALAIAAAEHYLFFPANTLVVNDKPKAYAKREGFDLLLRLPDQLPSFSGKTKNINLDEEVLLFCKRMGEWRLLFNKNPLRKTKRYNDITMERIS